MTMFFALPGACSQSSRRWILLLTMVLAGLVPLSTGCSRVSEAERQPDIITGHINDVTVRELPEEVETTVTSHDGNTSSDTGGFDGVGDVDAQVDSGDGQADSLPKACEAQLPMPGEACQVEGAIRCTNVGAHETPQRKGFCMRPNHLRCEPEVTGKLRWKLIDCAGRRLESIYNSDDCGMSWSCVADSSGDRCQPLVVVPVSAQIDAVNPKEQSKSVSKSHLQIAGFCYPTHKNPALRPGSSYVSCTTSLTTCTTLANTGPLAAGIKASFGKCGQYLEHGSWMLPVQICRITDFDCPNKPELNCVDPYDEGKFVPACHTSFKAGCFIDPGTNKPRCRENCKDAGAPYY